MNLYHNKLVSQENNTYKIEKIHKSINTSEYDEITPVVSFDGKTLYFTRVGSPEFARYLQIDSTNAFFDLHPNEVIYNLRKIYSEIAGTPIYDPIRCELNQEIWIAETENKPFDRVRHPYAPLNNALPNSVCSLTPQQETFVIINQFPPDGGLKAGFSLIRRLDDEWQQPEPIDIEDFTFHTGTGIGCTMSSDGEVLILSLPTEGGENDLFVSFRKGEKLWSKPQNLGKVVNSSGREITPHLSADGKELYFASNRSGSMGGLDVFYATRIGESWFEWSEVRHFIYPINTASDDTHPYFNPATGYLYFSSKREGSSDIFRVKIAPDLPYEVQIYGKVIDSQTGKPTDAQIMWGDVEQENYEFYIDTDEKGGFKTRIPQGKKVKIKTRKLGYINHEVEVTFDKNAFYSKPQEILLYVDPLEIGAAISLKPIYFQRSLAIIQKKSYSELDHLGEILRQQPKLHVRIEGHTSDVGTPQDLLKLSEQRAIEVKRYLVNQCKINTQRIVTQGFGDSRPITREKSEEAKQQNRRVEIRITKIY
jgi:outer membrane protein OmpA-like peptidoglycan-associated protein